MSGFLTTLLICVCVGLAFANTQRDSLFTDTPAALTLAEAGASGPSAAMMR